MINIVFPFKKISVKMEFQLQCLFSKLNFKRNILIKHHNINISVDSITFFNVEKPLGWAINEILT